MKQNNKEEVELCDSEFTGFDSDGIEWIVLCNKEKGHEGEHENKNGISW